MGFLSKKKKKTSLGDLFDDMFNSFFTDIDKLEREIRDEFKEFIKKVDIKREYGKVTKVIIDGEEYVKKEG
jgi:hypothetical protein